MRLLRSFGATRRAIVLALLIAIAVVTGAATSGRAADNGTVSATLDSVLNDQGTLVLGAPTPGKNIGYTFTFTNTGTNTLNHVVVDTWISSALVALTDKVGTSAVGGPVYSAFTYSNQLEAPVLCSGTPTLHCTQSQLAAGDSWTLTVIFSTNASPATGERIYPNFRGTYAPQSQNTSNNRDPGTKTFSFTTTVTNGGVRDYEGTVGGTKGQTLALPNDPLDVGSGFTADVTMPPGFLNNKKYVGVTLQNFSGATQPTNCPNCLLFRTQVNIPSASTFGPTDGPFIDGSTPPKTDPYVLSFTIPASNSFHPLGVFHSESTDGSGGAYLPACDLNPDGSAIPRTTAPGLCTWKITTQKGKAGVVFFTFWVVGVVNGSNYGG